jgi:hypothetical protein
MKQGNIIENVPGVEYFIYGFAEKIEILEKKQHTEIEQDAEPEIFPAALFFRNCGHPEADDVVYKGRTQQEENVFDLPAHIEIIADPKEHHPAEPVRN